MKKLIVKQRNFLTSLITILLISLSTSCYANDIKSYELPENTLNAILGYLYERPYKEVAGGIRMLEQLKPIVKEKEVKQ